MNINTKNQTSEAVHFEPTSFAFVMKVKGQQMVMSDEYDQINQVHRFVSKVDYRVGLLPTVEATSYLISAEEASIPLITTRPDPVGNYSLGNLWQWGMGLELSRREGFIEAPLTQSGLSFEELGVLLNPHDDTIQLVELGTDQKKELAITYRQLTPNRPYEATAAEIKENPMMVDTVIPGELQTQICFLTDSKISREEMRTDVYTLNWLKNVTRELINNNNQAGGNAAVLESWCQKLGISFGNNEMEQTLARARLVYCMVGGGEKVAPAQYLSGVPKEEKGFLGRKKKSIQETDENLRLKLQRFVDKYVKAKV